MGEPKGALDGVADVRAGEGSGSVHRLVILAHSAGGSMESKVLEDVVRGLVESPGGKKGLLVVRFNFPYRSVGRAGPPDRMTKLVESVVTVVEHVMDPGFGKEIGVELELDDVYLGGASMGCRAMAEYLVHHGHKVEHILSGLIFLGYPLHPSGKKDKLRDAPLLALEETTRLLFVSGDRDALCDPALLASTRQAMAADSTLVTIPGADHSFGTLKSSSLSPDDVAAAILSAVSSFVAAPPPSHTPFAISVPPSKPSSPTNGKAPADDSPSRKRIRVMESAGLAAAPTDDPCPDIQVVPGPEPKRPKPLDKS